jgi:hypothetical protein
MSASIVDCMNDADVFGPWFYGPSWDAWRAVLKGAVFQHRTGTPFRICYSTLILHGKYE